MNNNIKKKDTKDIKQYPKVKIDNNNNQPSFNLHDPDALFRDLTTSSTEKLHLVLEKIINFNKVDGSDSKSLQKKINASLAALSDLEARDPVESMLIHQLIVTNEMFHTCSTRANISNQNSDRIDEYIKHMTKLSRLFLNQIRILNSYRNQGQQKVKVEHVHISDGGQAVFGDISSNKRGG